MLILAGLILGLLSATISESFFHKFFGHPSERVQKFYFRHASKFKVCLKPYFQHLVIHHNKNYLNHFFKQFDSPAHKKDVDSWIRKTFDKNFAKLVFVERYNLTLKGFTGTLPFAGPFCIGPAIIGLTLGPVAFTASLVTAYIPVWLSKYVHPLVHQPHETYERSAFIQWLMRTKYIEKVLLNHYLHHQSDGTNFNLLLGGDYLLGLHRKPTKEEEQEFKVLLAEFRIKVRAKAPQKTDIVHETQARTFKQIQIQSKKNNTEVASLNYLNISNPTIEQRYKFQKEIYKNLDKTDQLFAEYENYGFSLMDKGIDFNKWIKREEFGEESYNWINGSVVYRGTTFVPGDVLLTNQNSNSDGLFSTLLDKPIEFSHVALFTVLEVNSQKFPAVLEMNEDGIRAVPLKALMSPHFNLYVEVFRPVAELSKELQKKIGQASIEVLNEIHAFDIYQDRTQNRFLNCARTIELVYKKIGIDLNIGDSKYHEKTYSNLHVLGIQGSIGKNLLMPDDYSRSNKFKLTGFIANGEFNKLMARNLVRFYIQKIWRTEELVKSQFPLSYYINFATIGLVRKDNLFSSLILKLIKIKKDSFPSGPTTFLSLVTFSDNEMKAAVKSVYKFLSSKENYENDTWFNLKNDPTVLSMMNSASSDFLKMFDTNSKHKVTRVKVARAIGRGLKLR